MSFGFSVGDFAVFTKFATKVVKALRDEGGSKIEYQIAERQCEEFLSAASELNSLDLSRLPESFRERLIASAANFSIIIKQFRKTIESYERSLGEKSRRGTFFSAPKKVQWALLAAEDLASVRQALTAQMSLIHLAIETNLLSRLNQADQSLSVRSSDGGMRGLVYPRRAQIGWHGEPGDRGLSIRQIEGIADVIYERLLTRPGIPLQPRGTARTLPDGIDIAALGLRTPHEAVLPLTRNSARPAPPQIEDTNSSLTDDHAEKLPKVNDLNSYLQDINLDVLSEEEIEYANIGSDGSIPALISASGHDAAEISSAAGPGSNQHQTNRHSETRGRRVLLGVEPPIDPFTTTGIIFITSRILGLVNVSTGLFMRFSMIHGKLSGVSREESYILSRRFAQYASVFQILAKFIHDSAPTGASQNLCYRIINDSRHLLDNAMALTKHLSSRHDGILYIFYIRAAWYWSRKSVLRLMGQLDSLDSRVNTMLQLHQINIAERNLEYQRALSSNTDVERVRRSERHYYA